MQRQSQQGNSNYKPNLNKKQYSDHRKPQQKTPQQIKELEEIREAYQKIQKKIDQYEEQNKLISNDNKIKSKKIIELNKQTSQQKNKIQKIKNTIKLSQLQIANTEESNKEAQNLIEQNQLCQNGDEENTLYDFTVYSIIYSELENNNAQFLICRKRKKEYWLADSKKSGYKQLYKNGVMLKQVFDNQLSLPSGKVDIQKDKKVEQIQQESSRQLKEQLCIDFDINYSQLEAPEPFIQQNYAAVYYKLSPENFKNLLDQSNLVLEKVQDVIKNDLKSDQYDDSMEKYSESFEKLMTQYGWKLNDNQKWEFQDQKQIPQITLSTTFKRAESLDFIQGQSTISNWKSPHQRLDWYYNIIDNLKKELKFTTEAPVVLQKKKSF